MLVYDASLNCAKGGAAARLQYAILADCRERKVIPHLTHVCAHTVRQIECGDFQVWCRDPDTGNERPVAVVERKTWKDMASSIVDGRADSQHARMLDFRATTGALVYYVIEGPVFQSTDRMFGRSNLTFGSLVKRLDHWAASGQLVVTHSRDHADTARRVAELVRNFSCSCAAPLVFQGSNLDTTASPPVDCRVAVAETRVGRQWTVLPGVSLAKAQLLGTHYTLAEFLAQEPSEANVVNVMGRLRAAGMRCGMKTASKMLAVCRGCAVSTERFLGSIRGISKMRARLIVQQFPGCVVAIARGNEEMVDVVNGVEGIRMDRTIGQKIKAAIFQ